MLFRTTFPEIFQFANNHIFRRSNFDRDISDGISAEISKRPGMQLIPTDWMEIGLQTRCHMDEVKLSILLSSYFHKDDLGRRNVKGGRRISFQKLFDILHSHENYRIDVMGNARFTIQHRRNAICQ